MIELFGHPFSSYTWKALIALRELGVPFEFRIINADHPDNAERLRSISPMGKFPALIDAGVAIFEATIIIEYLEQIFPGRAGLIPSDPSLALEVRMLDRFFDNYVMTPMQQIVADFIRAPAFRDPQTVAHANEMLDRAYAWLDGRLSRSEFVCGRAFTLADCAAAPALFYSDWVREIGAEFASLRAYRGRMVARPSVTQCIEEARPFRSFFPPGAPDRD